MDHDSDALGFNPEPESPNVIAPGLPTASETSSGTRWASIASKFMTERLMSGVSTLMPADRQSLRYTAALSRLLFTLVRRHAKYSTG